VALPSSQRSPRLVSLALVSLALVSLILPAIVACSPPPARTAPVAATAPAPVAAGPSAPEPVREADEYTRYELLAPGSTVFFNPIRKGSAASGESVRDVATGEPLRFEVVSGEEARRSGLPEADAATSFIRIHLARPVPAEGGARLLIEKTYEDAKSYRRDGADGIVFARPLGIRRNSIVLPAGYELVACNVPAQVLPAPDGRLVVSFMHTGPDAAPLVLKARKLARGAGS
jgi:hypothetical protein